jgi:hypothetical protein
MAQQLSVYLEDGRLQVLLLIHVSTSGIHVSQMFFIVDWRQKEPLSNHSTPSAALAGIGSPLSNASQEITRLTRRLKKKQGQIDQLNAQLAEER